MSKKGQITIFVIIAIVIVAAIIGLYLVRDSIDFNFGSSEFDPIYESFDNCVLSHTEEALSIAGTQAGYIETPEFVSGSQYAPFSSQLSFVGVGVPYWYYLSANGVIKEQVPSKNDIEKQLGEFLALELERCDFSSFREQGFVVEDNEIDSVDVGISSNSVKILVERNLVVSKGEEVSKKTIHEIKIDSNFGKLYDTALEFYERQSEEALLENYSLDVMYNYAPVTGSEISCSPLIWNPNEISEGIKSGLGANVAALKVKGDYYELKDEKDKYFVLDFKSDSEIRFSYDPSWLPDKVPAPKSVTGPIGPQSSSICKAAAISAEFLDSNPCLHRDGKSSSPLPGIVVEAKPLQVGSPAPP